MSFLNKNSAIIRRSNKDMFYIHLDNKVAVDYFDKNNNLIHSTFLTNDESLDHTCCYFTLDKSDNIYGVYNESGLKMIECKADSYNFSSSDILKYNHKKFGISFPYLEVTNDSIHILYYVYNNSSANTCALFHHYKNNGIWTENKIDFINHTLLDNFCVTWSQNCPIVFYFNTIDGFEELFFSKFNLSTLTWSNPVQITNSNKHKLYLSILKDSMNFYHIAFCEYDNNGYRIKYMNGYLNDDMLNVDICTYITDPSTCMYPSFVKKESVLYLMWVEYGRLYTSTSNNLGKQWSAPILDEFSVEDNFVRAKFFSNYKEDIDYNVSSIFTVRDNVAILGKF